MKRVLQALLLCAPTTVLSGELTITAPPGAVTLPVSVYEADDAFDTPIAQFLPGQAIDIPSGRYVLGIDGFPWRSAPVLHQEESEIHFGAVSVSAPETVQPGLTVHGQANGSLLQPVSGVGVFALPAGDYHVRLDLSEAVWPISIKGGETTELPFGVVTTPAPLAEGLFIYLAPMKENVVAGILGDGGNSIALPAGAYRARSAGIPETFDVLIEANETETLSVRQILGYSFPEAPRMTLGLGSFEAEVRPGEFRFALLGEANATLSASEQTHELPPANHFWLWQYANGELAHLDGIRLLAADSMVAIPGEVLEFTVLAGIVGDAAVSLFQEGAEVFNTDVQVDSRQQHVSIPIPNSTEMGKPLTLEFKMGPPDAVLIGVLRDVPVHQFLEINIESISVAESAPTNVTLSWTAPDEDGVAGYRVYRGKSNYPVSGHLTLTQTEFTDVGLSANRTYRYRICPVDLLGFDGPCTDLQTTTSRP